MTATAIKTRPAVPVAPTAYDAPDAARGVEEISFDADEMEFDAEDAAHPLRRVWTRADYYLAAEVGFFRHDEKLELIEGEVYRKVSPASPPHAFSVTRSAEAMRQIFRGAEFHIREEKPIVIDDFSEPEPDVAVVRGAMEDATEHPTPDDLALIIEVSETTLRFDRTCKAALYARNGIPEYWILGLRGRFMEVRRDPGLLDGNRWGYRSLQILTENDTIAPLAAPGQAVRVADLLPNPPASAASEAENASEPGDDAATNAPADAEDAGK